MYTFLIFLNLSEFLQFNFVLISSLVEQIFVMTGNHELKNVKMYLSLVRKYHNPLEIKSRIYISFQGRQKLARFNAREFTTLVIDILSDAKRRQTGALSPSQTPKELGKEIINKQEPYLHHKLPQN